MQEYRVGICDSDTGYVVGFMEYINMNKDIPLRVSAFSGVEAVTEYMNTNMLDLLLLDEKINKSDLKVKIINLTDIRDVYEDRECIYKYQCINKIVENIMQKLNEGKQYIKSGFCVYGVYSPIGRSGKTRFAKGICDYYKESLYIGFEEYSGLFNKTYESARYRDIYERFMYYLLSKNILIEDVVEELYKETGLKALVTLNYMDIKQVESHHIEWMLKQFKDNGGYARIVFDLGVGTLSDLDILINMDKVYVPVLKDKISLNKLSLFKGIISDKKYTPLEEKINYIEVPKTDYDSKVMKDFIVQGGI